MSDLYTIGFCFDTEDGPPLTLLFRDGEQFAEIFDEPETDVVGWSGDAKDWRPGDLARHVLDTLNAAEDVKRDAAPPCPHKQSLNGRCVRCGVDVTKAR